MKNDFNALVQVKYLNYGIYVLWIWTIRSFNICSLGMNDMLFVFKLYIFILKHYAQWTLCTWLPKPYFGAECRRIKLPAFQIKPKILTLNQNTKPQMGSTKFMRPKEETNGGEAENPRKLVSPNLYVANCGPAVGLTYEAISMAFSQFGEVRGVHAADDSGTRVIVSFSSEGSAESAFNAFNGRRCSQLAGRFLHIRYSVPRPSSPVAFLLISDYGCWFYHSMV